MAKKLNKAKIQGVKIKHLLTMAFGGLLLILLILGLASVTNISKITNNTRTLYDRPHTNLVGMWQIKSDIAQTGNGMREWILFGEPLSDELSGHFTSALQDLEIIESNKVDKSAPMSDNMKSIMEAINAWSSKGQELVNILKNNQKVSTEQAKEFTALEQAAITKVDSIIVTATENALKFRNGAVASAKSAIVVMIIIFVIAFLITLVLLQVMLRNIMNPMRILLKSAKEIELGNLNGEIEFHSSNEFGELADYFREMRSSLSKVVSDVTKNLEKMSHGDFRIAVNEEYRGDFEAIRQAIIEISERLGKTLMQINETADQVSTGSEQVSSGAQNLSQGSTEQASSIEELAAAMTKIASQVEQNAENAKDASFQAKKTTDELEVGKENMSRMLTAMSEINNSASEIGKIIKTIEDIAFQTNILALNAAVEAARAGEAGKGFAVVADEVRNLAGKSSEASKNTSELIENSIRAVKEGTDIANETAESLNLIVESSEKSTGLLHEITKASGEQAKSIDGVRVGVEQIAAVVQSNSATAEESAASSEELSGQAQILKSLVSEFKL